MRARKKESEGNKGKKESEDNMGKKESEVEKEMARTNSEGEKESEGGENKQRVIMARTERNKLRVMVTTEERKGENRE